METIIRWLARISSLLTMALVLGLAIGEGLNLSQFTGRELVLFLFFPLGMCGGLITGWWREGLGGGIAAGSLAGFYVADWLTSGSFPRGFAFGVIALPGFLFTLSAILRASRLKPRVRPQTPERIKP